MQQLLRSKQGAGSDAAAAVNCRCIGPAGLMARATRVLVTHQRQYLPQCDRVMVLRQGRVHAFGTWPEIAALQLPELVAGALRWRLLRKDLATTWRLLRKGLATSWLALLLALLTSTEQLQTKAQLLVHMNSIFP